MTEIAEPSVGEIVREAVKAAMREQRNEDAAQGPQWPPSMSIRKCANGYIIDAHGPGLYETMVAQTLDQAQAAVAKYLVEPTPEQAAQ